MAAPGESVDLSEAEKEFADEGFRESADDIVHASTSMTSSAESSSLDDMYETEGTMGSAPTMDDLPDNDGGSKPMDETDEAQTVESKGMPTLIEEGDGGDEGSCQTELKPVGHEMVKKEDGETNTDALAFAACAKDVKARKDQEAADKRFAEELERIDLEKLEADETATPTSS